MGWKKKPVSDEFVDDDAAFKTCASYKQQQQDKPNG